MKNMERLLARLLVCILAILHGFIGAGAEQTTWDCPECGRTGNTKNYCGSCAHPAPWIDDASLKLSRDEFSKVGNIVRFGHYEQDNNLDNGSEEIEWIVLDAQKGRSLLISKYGLEAKPYNTTLARVTWETCTLRNWLNSDFMKAAFEAKEQSAILKMTVDNSKSQGYSGYNTDGGKNTQDQIFLLSYYEVFDLYFRSDDARKCVPTKYAKAHMRPDGGWWWLRSPGVAQLSAAYVSDSGARYSNFYRCSGAVSDDSTCVRPAFWINLESEIFESEIKVFRGTRKLWNVRAECDWE